MVAGEIGENGAAEVQTGSAVLHLAVAAHLHGRESAAGIHHLAQQTVSLQR